MDKDAREFLAEIQAKPICTPGDSEYVDRCFYSKTGWAIWKQDGGCTCRPAEAPPERNDTCAGEGDEAGELPGEPMEEILR